MYGPFDTHGSFWSESAIRPPYPMRPFGGGATARVIALPAGRLRPANTDTVGVDLVLRARFWRLALPALGLFWAGLIWGIAG